MHPSRVARIQQQQPQPTPTRADANLETTNTSAKRASRERKGSNNNNGKGKAGASTSSSNGVIQVLSKRIQHANRLLSASTTAANVRVEMERALAVDRQDLAVLEAERRRQKMIKKYHKARFFERQKATRQLKKLRRLLDEKPSVLKTEIERRIHETEVDLNYALYFPLDEDYVPLYPRRRPKEEDDDDHGDEQEGRSRKRKRPSLDDRGTTKDGDDNDRQADNIDHDDDDVEKVRPPLWKEVERRMQADTLVQLRNGQRSRVVSNTIGHLRPSPSSHDYDDHHHHRKLEPAQTRKRLVSVPGKQQQQHIKGVTDPREVNAVQAANLPRREKGPSKQNSSGTDHVTTGQSGRTKQGSATTINDDTEDGDEENDGFFEGMN